MDKKLEDLQNLFLCEEVDDKDVTLYFASHLHVFKDYDNIINDEEKLEICLNLLSKTVDKLPSFSSYDSHVSCNEYV